MSNRRALLLIILSLAVLAGGLRFFRLGAWPFHSDEVATLWETDALFRSADNGLGSQIARLPKLIPLSYVVTETGYELCGRDEFGSRVIFALLGTLHVLIVFVGLDRPLGRVPALATALLFALWPEHLFRSQENRFYMTAAVAATLCMVLGAQAVYRRSLTFAALASVAALAAVLTHTLEGLLLAGLFVGFFAAARISGDARLARFPWVVVVGGLGAVAVFVVHVLPLVRGWNSGEAWGYSGLHSIMSSLSQLGWPVALLAALGAFSAIRRWGEQDGYWLAWAGLWGVVTVVLPLIVVYHPGYVFPLSLGAMVLAGQAVAQIYEGLRAQNRLAAGAWVGLAAMMSLPGVVSHYVDGSRFDFREPAQHVSAHWQPGDRLAGTSSLLLRHYLPEGIEPIPVKGTDPVPHLQRLAREPGRLWIIFPSGRGGKPEALRAWLGKNCKQQLVQCKKRFDYYENTTEVYLYEPPETRPHLAPGFAEAGGSQP